MPCRRAVRTSLVVVALGLLLFACAPAPRETEILWDTWGVPHIYAASHREMYRAFGWAQMRSHGNLLLHLVGEARGRAAEYWGEDFLESDRWVRIMGIPRRAAAWYDAQSPGFRSNLDAFAAGMNEYIETHEDAIAEEVRGVAPVTPLDILAHTQRVVHFVFVTDRETAQRAQSFLGKSAGSNAWAVAPSRAAGGRSMLLANPHLPWRDLYLFYEAHLVGRDVDFYGTTLVGFPVLLIGFNDHLGWTHTVNTFDGADTYELQLRDGGYLWEGAVEPFETREETIRIRQEDGSLREERLAIRASRHGPLIAEEGDRAVALRVAGLDAPRMLEEWWNMMRAANLHEFEAALRDLQIPMFNVVYADRDGNILYLFNGRVPRRPSGDYAFWEIRPAPGDSAATLWNDTHAFDDLPRILNPSTGWVQNANDPPWTATDPPVLDAADFPAYMAPQFMHFRAQRSAQMLAGDPAISFDELVAYKHSTRVLLADRLLDDLLPALASATSDTARRAAEVLAAWDRRTDASSRGAVLFLAWTKELGLENVFNNGLGGYKAGLARFFAIPWDPAAPFATPDGLRDTAAAVAALERAAKTVRESHGSLDVPWGEVFRLRQGDMDLAGNGGPGDPGGIFRAVYYVPDEDGKQRAIGGDSFYAAIEFTDPPRASVLMTYGNASQPGSPHAGDQLELFARQEMRPAWLTRDAIEAHLEERTRLPAGGREAGQSPEPAF